MIDLSPAHLAIVKRILAEHVSECGVWAFGSRATWNAKDHSDLDLAVVGDGPLPRGTLARLKESFEESTLPMRVDVLDWHDISESFRKVIKRHYAVVQDGAAPDGWRTVALGELVRNFDSRRIPLSRRVRSERPGPYPYYGATGVMDHVDDYIFQGLHLLVAEDGSVETSAGRSVVQLVDGQFWVNNHAHVLRGTTDEETRYLYYALSTVQVRPFMSGSVQAKLSQRNLNQIPVPYPAEDSERRAIARVLGALDDKIEHNRRMSATLEAMARALFKSWFVDFEPVRAKAEGRPSGLPPALDALFPASFEASELGQIPSGWGVRSLDDVAETVRGRSYRSAELAESDTALVTLKSFARGGGYRPDGLKPYTGKYKPAQIVGPGELVIACTDVTQAAEVVGRPAIVPADQRFTALVASLDTLIIRPRDVSAAPVPFLYCLTSEPSFTQHTYAHVSGTTVLHLSKEAVPAFKFALPPSDLMRAFIGLAGPAFKRMTDLSGESAATAAQRDALLPRLVSGEVRVGSGETACA